MIPTPAQVDVLMCTFRRPEVVATLQSLDQQTLPDGVSLRIIVADNDETPSAAKRVTDAAQEMQTPVHYVHAPARNISIARNAGLDAAKGDWVAFIDDDETAPENWIANLLLAINGHDGAFGPAIALYDDTAPDWMATLNVHSNIPERRGETVETGHTCNALLRWADTPWHAERFDLARGKTGGEDTEFFFRVRAYGASFTLAENAVVTEPVAPSRLQLGWLLQRKYRQGQSYAVAGTTALAKVKLAGSAVVKVLACGVAGLASVWSEQKRMFWLLRGAMHIGVISGCLSLKQPEIYGHG
ncbi:MAG: glycosyltransferase family 2 protein [Pseudomonadota bacterium]